MIRVLRAILCFVRAMRRWFKEVRPAKTKEIAESEESGDTKEMFGVEEKRNNHPFVESTIEIMKRLFFCAFFQIL